MSAFARFTTSVAAMITGLLLFTSLAQAAGPTTTTGAATEIHGTFATVSGTVNPGGVELEECAFEYGETESYGNTAPCKESPAEIGSGSADVAVDADVTELTATTPYHFRLEARSSGGTGTGSDATFTTSEGPAWKLTVIPSADWVIPGSEHPAAYKIVAENIGAEPTSGRLTLENILPAGLSADAVGFFPSEFNYFDLSGFGLCPSTSECEFPGVLEPFFGIKGVNPHQRLVMTIRVPVPSGFPDGPLEVKAKVAGGGALPAEASANNEASAEPAFGKFAFDSSITDASKVNPYTQAGGHPFQFTTDFTFGTYACAAENDPPEFAWIDGTCPMGDPKDIASDLPPGLLANPQGVPHCSVADFFSQECEGNKVEVGRAGIRPFAWTEGASRLIEPVYNLQPQGNYPGELGITVNGAPLIIITTGIRSDGDYSVTANSLAIQAGLNHVRLTLWGVPAAEEHNHLRGGQCFPDGFFRNDEQLELACESESGNTAAEVPPTPFLTMPTECSGNPIPIVGRYDSWQVPGEYARRSVDLPAVDGCNNLSFEPTITARPTTNLADAPSGLDFRLHIPQNEDPEGVATPEMRESVVKLPAGLSINPASGDGLTGCTEAQIGLHSEEPAHCPDASKLGTAEIHTPLLNQPLQGALYLATPYQNPSGSLLAAYLSLEGSGIKIKVPGIFETDPQTGQITTRFPQNPQLPFEDLELNTFGGARGALRTPAVCGTYKTTSSLTPFSAPESGPPATPTATFTTTTPENGGACPANASQLPSAPLLRAGTETPQAGIYSPFALRLVREDGSQEVTGVETTLPEGLVGKLAGIPYCTDAAIAAASHRSGTEEKASPSCPAASELGSVEVAAGAGPTPINVPGRVYLAGPYKGAPLSVAIVTPATAGPFDLGTVAVRAALYVNPETTQITARSDEIPHILQGIPLDIRSVTMKLNRFQFTLNPTSCEESHFTGTATSPLGATSPLEQRFQVGGCAALGFKPKLALSVTGGTKRRGHPALKAVLRLPAGGANVARAQVALPPTEILDNAHINSPCTRVEFAANACPPGSILGSARAETPLLDQPLEGPVYLMTGFGHKLPDLIADLRGQIHVILDGRVDSTSNGGLRNTFEVVPDAPVSKFVLELQGGKKGLLQNTTDVCKSPQRASVLFAGQNAKSLELNPKLRVRCAKPKRHRNHNRAARRTG